MSRTTLAMVGGGKGGYRPSVDEYAVGYNNLRVQERLKGLTPMQYRNQALQTLPA